MKIDENISTEYDEQIRHQDIARWNARVYKSDFIKNYANKEYFLNYKITQSIIRVKTKISIVHQFHFLGVLK